MHLFDSFAIKLESNSEYGVTIFLSTLGNITS